MPPAPDKFLLSDRANEKKWDFKLTEAIERAKAKGGQIFKGVGFYVTQKVAIDKKLLRSVVEAHGGFVSLIFRAISLWRSG